MEEKGQEGRSVQQAVQIHSSENMTKKKTIFAIIGSASKHSSNEKLIETIADLTKDIFSFTVFKDLKKLPHFDPEQSTQDPPQEIVELRQSIKQADGLLICTPEYVFSIPSGLKNAIEWCIATTIFTNKPTGLITASAHGQKGHEELQLIMKTAMATFTDETCLWIQGIKGKVNEHGLITDSKTNLELNQMIEAFKNLVFENHNASS
mgnify:CR=1 FL=1